MKLILNLFTIALIIAQSAAAQSSNQPVTVRGEAFDAGLDQPYLFAGMTITAYKRQAAERALNTYSSTIRWPDAIAQTTTNSRGEYTINLPAGDWLLVAEGRRRFRGSNTRWVDYRWTETIKARTGEHVRNLTADNAQLKLSGSVGWGEKGQPPGRF